MFYKKHKNNLPKVHRTSFYGIIILAVIMSSLAIIIRPIRVEAARARCEAAQLVGNNGEVGTCFTNGHPRYPVANNPPGSPATPLDDHCYKVQNSDYGLLYYDTDCSHPPFNTNWQSVLCEDGTTQEGGKKFGTVTVTPDMLCKDHGGAAHVAGPRDADCKDKTLTQDNCGIVYYLLKFINALAALMGIVVTIMIIIGGIQYSTAGNDPQKMADARGKITNALLALLMFIFMYSFLQWVVPGGVF